MACDTGVILVTWPDLLPPGPSAYRVRQCGDEEAAIDLRAVARRGRRARRGPGNGGRPRGRLRVGRAKEKDGDNAAIDGDFVHCCGYGRRYDRRSRATPRRRRCLLVGRRRR